MNFKIVKLHQLSGPECSIYTVLWDGIELFEEFILNMVVSYPTEVKEIKRALRSITERTGARINLFKEWEGIPGDGVCCLCDDNELLRLFCIRNGKNLIILGGGGRKDVQAWQDDSILKVAGERMITISKALTRKIQDKEIEYINDWYDLEGDLNFDDNED